MDLATGAMGVLPSKVLELLNNEYKLQTSVRGEVQFLSDELECMYTALCKVAQVPHDKLDPIAKLWSRNVREASYDIEDILDSFLVRVDGGGPQPLDTEKVLRRLWKKVANLLGFPNKLKARHDIATAIVGIRKRLEEMAAQHARYRVDHLVANSAAAPASVDPRLNVLYKKVSKLFGIDEPRDALIEMLSLGQEETSSNKMKIVSIVGFGGLGKTTLAKEVYDKVNLRFDCWAFVSVGQNPEPENILRDFLIDLIDNEKKFLASDQDLKRYSFAELMVLNVKQLVKQLHQFLQGKRYFIVVDDIWDKKPWEEIIMPAFPDSDNGSRVIATTRKLEVAKEIGDACYKMKELSPDNSRELLYIRFGGEDKWPDTNEVADKILQKCHGIPLAIIAVASLLAQKPIDEWSNVYSSIGFERGDQVDNMMKIISFSYYDLPCHLRTCMLYLSVFPEDRLLAKNMVIWRWIAEGIIHTEIAGREPFEVGDSYFHELINRGLILPCEVAGIVRGCRVHDLVLHLIRGLSSEENFVAVLDSKQRPLPRTQGTVRRLALHKIRDNKVDNTRMTKVRSFNAFLTKPTPPVAKFQLLRVLTLEYCWIDEGHLKHIGKLRHLRYLGLKGPRIRELPEEVGCLEFLETLMVEGTGIEELPKSLEQHKTLMCLRADKKTRVPDWIGKLTSLVELMMYPVAESKSFVKELGKLTHLRVLETHIILKDEEQATDLLESLSNLQKIEIIKMPNMLGYELQKDTFVQQSLILCRNLRKLDISVFLFPRLPESIDPQALPNLYSMSVFLMEMCQQDMEIIGRFQKLCFLFIVGKRLLSSISISSGDGFHNLKSFHARFSPPTLVKQGAMPSLEHIDLLIKLHFVNIDDLDLDSGLGNLPSLQQCTVIINCAGCCPAELEEVEDVVRHAVGIHPNRPTIKIHRIGEDEMVKRRRAKLGELQPNLNLRDIMHKLSGAPVKSFLGRLDATRVRAHRELPPRQGATHDDDLNTGMEDKAAALKRAFEIRISEDPRLKARLLELRAASTQRTVDEGTHNIPNNVTEETVVEDEPIRL